MTTAEFDYGFSTKLRDASYGDAVNRTKEALSKEGFGVLSEVDVKETFRQKLGADFRHYVILGACNPPLAKQALEAEPHIGLLLPCNVVVQQDSAGSVTVSIADPKAMFSLVNNPKLEPVADDVAQRLRRVIASLAA